MVPQPCSLKTWYDQTFVHQFTDVGNDRAAWQHNPRMAALVAVTGERAVWHREPAIVSIATLTAASPELATCRNRARFSTTTRTDSVRNTHVCMKQCARTRRSPRDIISTSFQVGYFRGDASARPAKQRNMDHGNVRLVGTRKGTKYM